MLLGHCTEALSEKNERNTWKLSWTQSNCIYPYYTLILKPYHFYATIRCGAMNRECQAMLRCAYQTVCGYTDNFHIFLLLLLLLQKTKHLITLKLVGIVVVVVIVKGYGKWNHFEICNVLLLCFKCNFGYTITWIYREERNIYCKTKPYVCIGLSTYKGQNIRQYLPDRVHNLFSALFSRAWNLDTSKIYLHLDA